MQNQGKKMPPNDVKSFGSDMVVKIWKSSKLADIVVLFVCQLLHIVVEKFVFKPLTSSFVDLNLASIEKQFLF